MSRKQKQIKNNILLDIGIITAGRVDLLKKCIEAVLPQISNGFQIHVFNNGNPSSEYNEVYKLLPIGSEVKQQSVNTGFPEGANSTIRMGNAPLVLFMSDDIFLHPRAIQTLLRRMDDPTIALCGLKLLFPDDSSDPTRPAGKVQHVGHATNIRGEIYHPLMGWSPENPKCNISREVISVTGGCFIVRRKLFQQARGFNPIYGMGYFEDADLCLTLRTMGYKVFIDTDAVATHGVAQTFMAKKDTVAPDLPRNAGIFGARHAKNLTWTDYEFY